MPDLARWGKEESYLPFWSGRAEIVGELLNDCASVLDIGAGAQLLKPYIKGEYFPADCVALYPNTILIDLDSDFSATTLPSCEGVALAGVLEHVKDPLQVINKLSRIGRAWAVSYMDKTKHPRYQLIAIPDLEEAFLAAGFDIAAKVGWKRQFIYRLERR